MQATIPAGRPRPVAVSLDRYEDRPIAGLPADPRVVMVSTSERTTAACPRRWYYNHGLGLRSAPTGPMDYGTAWHDFTEDLRRCWMAPGAPAYDPRFLDTCWRCSLAGFDPACGECGGFGLGPVLRAQVRWLTAQQANTAAWGAENEDGETVEHRVDRLRRAAHGRLVVYGATPPPGYEVAAVDLAVACPVYAPGSTSPYAPEVFLAAVEGGWRFARPGDDPASVRAVRWPWYWVGKLDAVYRSLRDGSLLVVEDKTSADPAGYLRGVTIDPQTTGYVAMAAHAIATGALAGSRVAGWRFEVASSGYQYDPAVLKDGKLSLAANRTVPSWRFEQYLADHKIDPAPYLDHVDGLRERVDPRLYLHEQSPVGAEDVAQWHVESWATCRVLAEHRRAAWRAGDDPVQVAGAYPRQPVCRLPGGHCAFRGPCARDGADARSRFERRDGPSWIDPQVSFPAASAAPVTTDQEKESVPCP